MTDDTLDGVRAEVDRLLDHLDQFRDDLVKAVSKETAKLMADALLEEIDRIDDKIVGGEGTEMGESDEA